MNREIKFRAWNGMEMIYDVMVGRFGAFYVNPSNNGLDEKDSASLTPFNTRYHDTVPIMQFTGLKDKHGKEIYEGDIVQSDVYERGPTEVKWNYEHWHPFEYFMSSVEEDFEIVGNIYQNPKMI